MKLIFSIGLNLQGVNVIDMAMKYNEIVEEQTASQEHLNIWLETLTFLLFP